MAAVYNRAFEKLKDDADYAKNEIARLQRMIDSGSLQSTKIDEFTQRINMLKKFEQQTPRHSHLFHRTHRIE